MEITEGKDKYKVRLVVIKSGEDLTVIISGGEKQVRTSSFEITQKRKNNRCLQKNRKGFKPSIRKQRYAIRPKDLIKVEGKLFVVKTIFNYGKWVKLFDKTGKIINKSIKKVDWVFHNKTLIWEINRIT